MNLSLLAGSLCWSKPTVNKPLVKSAIERPSIGEPSSIAQAATVSHCVWKGLDNNKLAVFSW